MNQETPNTVHGRLLESSHFAGYSFKRAWDELKWLLQDDRWKELGFADGSAFAESIYGLFAEFKGTIDQRKEVANALAGIASQRAIAKVLGVGKDTVSRDLGRGANAPSRESNAPKTNDHSNRNGAIAPAFALNVDPYKLAKKLERQDQRRRVRPANPTQLIAPELRVGDFRKCLNDVADNSVSLIFTDPPYNKESIPLYGDLAEFGSRVLKPGGSLLVYCGHYALFDIGDLIRPHLKFHWLLSDFHDGGRTRCLPGAGVKVFWKPILWLTKGSISQDREIVVDCFKSKPPDKSFHRWSQSEALAEYYLKKLSAPGDLLIDPFVGGGTTILAARKLGRSIVGCDVDEEAILRASERLARDGAP